MRPGVYLFYWLYFTTAQNVTNPYDRPLIIWLQGGPGASSTGYGNFIEIGPRTSTGELRNESWVDYCNVLFIDSPVGSGFSYAESDDLMVTTDKGITNDLISFLQIFLDQYPQFRVVDLHIFGESYGGKVVVNLAMAIHVEVLVGKMNCNLVSIGLGSPWISPVDTAKSYPEFLHNTGLIEKIQAQELAGLIQLFEDLMRSNDFTGAAKFRDYIHSKITMELLEQVDIYNILGNEPGNWFDPEFERFMNTTVYEELHLNREKSIWQYLNMKTFQNLNVEIMRPATNIVERILNETNINIMVYSGQLDLIVTTPGTEAWVNKLAFEAKEEYKQSSREAFRVDQTVEGYCKKSQRLSFCWIRRAGHSAPKDNPKAMRYVLQSVLWPSDVYSVRAVSDYVGEYDWNYGANG